MEPYAELKPLLLTPTHDDVCAGSCDLLSDVFP
jgi:hypothetical protein